MKYEEGYRVRLGVNFFNPVGGKFSVNDETTAAAELHSYEANVMYMK